MQDEDLEFLERFKTGDESAFEEFLFRYQDRIYTLCRYMLGDAHDAEDAAQDVFIKAHRGLKDFSPGASGLYTWLYRIAVNTCIDYRRRPFFASLWKDADEGGELQYEPASEAPSPEKLYEAGEISSALSSALRRLSPKLRSVIVLKEVEGLSYEEIAGVLDLSLGTVKSRISRAREELRTLMKDFTEQN